MEEWWQNMGNKAQGKVYLVGAGPGKIDLMTRRAYALVKQADCLIYDHLIDTRILDETKEGCEQIYVGKIKRCHAMKQENINQLLVDKASEYPCVVRLKGGDVYVFGRGGEEGQCLKEHHVPFEVVPGVSSSIGGLAYAGIPITHRGLTTGFRVVTAHSQLDMLADIDFEGMAKSDDTCVFLMGLTKLNEIVEKLLCAGKDKDSKVAVVSKATFADQKVVVSTLEHIREEIEKCPLPSPAIIVVGEVVGMREYLNFFEERALFNQRILLTRVGDEPSKLSQKLEDLGTNVTEVQVSRLVENKEALDQVDYQAVTHVVLSSRSAVQFFMNSLRKNEVDIRTLAHIQFAVVGACTAKALLEYGVRADLVPDVYEGTELIQLLENHVTKGSCVLVPKVAGEHAEWERLAQYCKVEIIELYQNCAVETEVLERQLEQEWDMVVFTCSSSVERTLQVGNVQAKKFISIGSKTSETLEKYHISNYDQSKQATYDSIVELILELQEN